jgi:hypothetical protein
MLLIPVCDFHKREPECRQLICLVLHQKPPPRNTILLSRSAAATTRSSVDRLAGSNVDLLLILVGGASHPFLDLSGHG